MPSDRYTSFNQINISSDNGSSPVRRPAIIRFNDGFLSTLLLGTNTSEI